jgi:hypothetical protein
MVGHDLLYVLVDKIFALGISTGLYDAHQLIQAPALE